MNAPSDALSWQTWKSRWPNAAASRFVRSGGMQWHVQVAGTGTPLLLVHGTGGATHSWRDILPKLASTYMVIAPDLPGHAFTERPDGDGVLTKDIERGVDPRIAPPKRLEQIGSQVRFGFPPGRPARDPAAPSKWLRNGDDPIRFNNSTLASFGPLGTATPGTVFLTDGQRGLAAVRVTGRMGKVKVVVYDFEEEVWK